MARSVARNVSLFCTRSLSVFAVGSRRTMQTPTSVPVFSPPPSWLGNTYTQSMHGRRWCASMAGTVVATGRSKEDISNDRKLLLSTLSTDNAQSESITNACKAITEKYSLAAAWDAIKTSGARANSFWAEFKLDTDTAIIMALAIHQCIRIKEGCIWFAGLPPINDHESATVCSPSGKRQRDQSRVLDEKVQKDLGLLEDESSRQLSPLELWEECNGSGRKPFFFSSEMDIQQLVMQVLKKAAPKTEAVSLHFMTTTLTGAAGKRLTPDLLVILNSGIPVGVVEVKKPHKDNLENPYHLGQLLDYMRLVRSVFGVRDVFGILSSYKEWRVCWLPDSEKVASATVLFSPEEDRGGNGGEEEKRDTKRVLHVSRVFNYQEPELIPVLWSTLSKMANSPINPWDLEGTPPAGTKFVTIGSMVDAWRWESLKCASLSLCCNDDEMCVPDRSKFLLLRDLGSGRDGRVWRACTTEGVQVVVKFRTNPSEQQGEHERACMEEAATWQHLYGEGAAKVVRLMEAVHAVVMPYVPPLDESQKNDDVVRDKIRQEIRRWAVEKGKIHKDLEWRHVGITAPQDGNIVFFDLSDVGDVASGSESAVEAAELTMLRRLGLC